MIRMEIALFLILAFLAGMYFVSERKNVKLHKIFTALLITAMVNILFDGITVYTVNRLDEIPVAVNDVCHRIFVGSLVLTLYIFYRYISALVEEGTVKEKRLNTVAAVFLVIAEAGVAILPVVYIITPEGNYSMGMFAKVCYVAVALYLILCGGTLFGNIKRLRRKEQLAIGTALIIEIAVTVAQAFHPTWLISGMGITLMILAFYLTIENPDILRAELFEQKMSLRYLKSQVNPHFLYNTLGTIQIKAQLNDDTEVAQLLRYLTDFFRLSVKVDRQMVTLDDELELVDAYMQLMCARYPQIHCETDINPDLGMTEVPNFILQPVVENSFLHGLKNCGYEGDVIITADYAEGTDEYFEIRIKDTGAGFKEGKKKQIDDMLADYMKYDSDVSTGSIGVLNVQKRIKLLCGKKSGLSYEENEEGGVTAVILLPVERKYL